MVSKKMLIFIMLGTIFIFLSILSLYIYGRSLWMPYYLKIVGTQTVSDVITEIGTENREKLEDYFKQAGVEYPSNKIKIALLGFKEEKILEVWALQENKWHFIHAYPILAASGDTGPKLREGDKQVPEGIYQITWLNPNSTYYLSMKVSYPNIYDRKKAELDGRNKLGGDIFIHGKALSIGCLAIGDEAIEELFVLAHDVHIKNIKVILSPNDMRVKKPPFTYKEGSPWLLELYEKINRELEGFKR
ncbi:L,D-transpeptidase family protein [Shimazuella kribbensis]|uniref:L,D-transpeptidase family protein n=1 Tax=Shimazuella kribbensis TaxID=139808 RepID=UPI0004917DCB|nr:L,D-transpeptidase family protein [Shimazuella kribbensis]